MTDRVTGAFDSGSVPDNYRRLLEPVIFEPWAERLISFVGLAPGSAVLDVAAGTGVVTRAAATTVGPTGSVIASDISPGMLAQLQTRIEPLGAPVEIRVCSATELTVDDAAVDAVLCQQGLQFVPDRVGAAREMRRVLRTGGRVGVAVWSSSAPSEPFETYGRVLEAAGLDEPFPGAFRRRERDMSDDQVESALLSGGFRDVEVRVEQLELVWGSPDAVVFAIGGTPFGATIAALEPERQDEIWSALRDAFTDPNGNSRRCVTTAVLGRGTAA